MNGNILLSICIPTYNRPKEFSRMLDGLLRDWMSLDQSYRERVEILVRDDSDSLETQNIFNEKVANINLNHQYFKGEKIGVDAASIFTIEKSKGQFIWWCSDDDEIQNNALSNILKILESDPEINYVWLNFDFQTKGRTAVRRQDGLFADNNEILTTLGTNIGLITTHVFRRSLALESLPLARKHIVGFSFACLVPIFYTISRPGKYYFAAGPYLLCHPTTREEVVQITTKTGVIKNEAFNVYGVDFYNIVHEFDPYFSKQAIRRLLSTNFASLWRGMVVGWIGGWDTPNGKLGRMFKLYWSYPEFWLAFSIFILPLSFNKKLYGAYKLFFHERKFLGFSQIVKKCSWSNNE